MHRRGAILQPTSNSIIARGVYVPVTHSALPREIDGERWLFSPHPSSPRRASIRGPQRDRKGNQQERLLGRAPPLSSPPLHTSEKRKTLGRKVFGRGYEFTDSVERGLLFARGCGGFRQKPHAYLSFSLSLSLSSTFNAASPLPLGCVMEIAFARRERGRLGLFYNPTAEVRRNYYWANCILTNSKGVRV